MKLTEMPTMQGVFKYTIKTNGVLLHSFPLYWSLIPPLSTITLMTRPFKFYQN